MAAQNQKHHKVYGPKLPNPRISRSKEHRGRGSLGIYKNLCNTKVSVHYTTRAAYLGS